MVYRSKEAKEIWQINAMYGPVLGGRGYPALKDIMVTNWNNLDRLYI